MNQEEKHLRAMNMSSHIVWSATFLASGNAADNSQNLLSAAFSYYYAVFHAGFALINTDHTFHMSDMERIHHNKIESYLENRLPQLMAMKVKNLRTIREFLSYLGAGKPEYKLQIVRGHPIRHEFGIRKTDDIRGLIDFARQDSEEIFEHIYKEIEQFYKKEGGPLGGGRELFLNDYIDDDILLNVIPRDKDGNKIMERVYQLLSPKTSITK